jgi:hypothetical protein
LAVDSANFFVSSVALFATGYNLTVGYHDGSTNPPTVATVAIGKSTHVPYASYTLTGVGDFADTEGRITLGSIAEIELQPAGQFFFSYQGGKLDTDAIRPQIRGISSVSVINGNDQSPAITGDIWLVAGLNFRLTLATVGGMSQIQFDAVQGAGLTEVCECTGVAQLPPPIRTINNITADSSGNFTLEGNSCIDLTALPHGIRLDDTCSAPCCGCTELQALSSEIAYIGDQASTLQGIINRLQGSVDQTTQVVLGSRLGNDPCVSCS